MEYRIVRFYFKKPCCVMREGLTLEEAQEHCSDPETSSNTSSDPNANLNGPWFDGYEEM